MNQRRLYRSTDDRILAGVCGGVAAYFDVDPVIVRIIWFLSIFFTGTLTFWAYVVMIIVVPAESDGWQQPSPWVPGGAPITGAAPGGYAAAYAPPTDPNAAPAGQAAPAGDATAPAAGAAAPADGTATPDPNAPTTAAGFAASGPNQWTPGPGDWRWQRRADRWQRRMDRWENRHERGNGGLIFGLLLIVVGGLLAWHQVDPNVDLGLLWPLGVIALGILLVASSFRFGGRS